MTYKVGGVIVVHDGMWNDDKLIFSDFKENNQKIITSFKSKNCLLNNKDENNNYECGYMLKPIFDGTFAQLSDGRCYSFEALKKLYEYNSGTTRESFTSSDVSIINYIKKNYNTFKRIVETIEKKEENKKNFNSIFKPETLSRTKSNKSNKSKGTSKRRMTLG
jgi:hypothetical protein